MLSDIERDRREGLVIACQIFVISGQRIWRAAPTSRRLIVAIARRCFGPMSSLVSLVSCASGERGTKRWRHGAHHWLDGMMMCVSDRGEQHRNRCCREPRICRRLGAVSTPAASIYDCPTRSDHSRSQIPKMRRTRRSQRRAKEPRRETVQRRRRCVRWPQQ